ncbi:MAG: hypothetical protein FRX49_08032 [Trebouxia sp. A1-2]|nr:MAG: hypothetical protein FRX49_08032 [Trebouxia sp. A1-2]
MLSHAAPAVLETLPVPAASEIFAGSDLSNDTHLHEYLASQLLGADTANGAEKNQDIQQSHNSLSWPPVPFVPATYRSEALSLFGDHTAIDYEGALSPLRLCDGELPVSNFTATSESELVKGTASASSQDAAVRQETGKRRKLNKSLVPQTSSAALADKLAKTVAELDRLKEQQSTLENKNALLEKCLHLNLGQRTHQAMLEDASTKSVRHYISQEIKDSEQGPLLVSSVRGQANITVHEIAKMGVPEFASLWTDYIQSIGSCLLQIGGATEGPIVDVMHKLTDESSQLLGCIKLLNLKVHEAMLHGELDPTLAKSQSMTQYYSSSVALLQLSDEQLDDMEHLRRIYITRRAVLAREREALVAQTARCIINGQDQVPLPGSTKVSLLAAQLQQNAQEDYRVYHRIAAAARRGVLTTRQWAAIIVHAYPYLVTVESSLEAFASHKGRQPKSVILKAAQTDNMESEWLALQEYIELISQENPHDYLPLSKCSAFKSKVTTQGGLQTLMPFGTEAAISLHYHL